MAKEDYNEPDWNGSDWVVDNRLKHFLQKFLHKHSSRYGKLKNLKFCGSGVAHVKGGEPAVFLLANGESAKFYANTACHSVWACPRCAAVRMSKYREDIGAAIDALSTQYNMAAFMVTFTLPHLSSMKCADIYQLLLNTWNGLSHTGCKAKREVKHTITSDKGERGIKNRKGEVITHKKGETVTYYKDLGAWANMRETCQIKHIIRTYEFTHGDANGWHPHIHALFFMPRKLWKNIEQFEAKLHEQWWAIAKKQYIKLHDKLEPDFHVNHVADAEELFADWRKYPKTGHRAVFFSKTDDDSIREIDDPVYITDTTDSDNYANEKSEDTKSPDSSRIRWGADRELTDRYSGKIAAEGHYTPQQIIRLAFDLRYSDATESERLMHLYCEYALATFKHRRFDMSSRTGLTKIIREWKKTQTYVNRIKKNLTKPDRSYHVVAWFSELQWSQISFLERTTTESLKAYLLYVANFPDARELIAETLEQYDIKLIERKHDLEECVLKANNEHFKTDTTSAAVA